ncbi:MULTISPECIES: hypothetical protein [Pseudomonas]|uniref:Uncharacterized protein n=1 Tax=Pseudomonas rhodesiae TaxID=76760 RepID=A0A8I1JC48_9PSED|nr:MULTISPECIES: hypothetical protein [Pseudomonas]MBI6605829.1 hypothetical protein [Pseudomonas sp. S4_EA_1b]MBI6623494.1 hypothetical protein [Pseudomonas rhodesiae]
MSSTSLDYFTAGLAKAFERRRAMQQQTKQLLVQVQSADSVEGDANTITTFNNTITKLSEEQHKQTIVNTMIALIHKRKN